ncbi:MAG: hypothetical protein AAF517_07370, partial [Planctomycetota bacterium]
MSQPLDDDSAETAGTAERTDAAGDTEQAVDAESSGERFLERAWLDLPYVPDFLLDEVQYYFVPSKDDPKEVYHELRGKSAENWKSYYTKKGWNFVRSPEGDGPYRVKPGETRLGILEPGRIFAPKPKFRLEENGAEIPIAGIDKRRPLNPWKPTYLKSLAFIKKYSWAQPVARSSQAAIWEIEECGEIAGSTSWMNAEELLLRDESAELKEVLKDIFFQRPEDFPLGSEVYLRVLGCLGDEGFEKLLEAGIPQVGEENIYLKS